MDDDGTKPVEDFDDILNIIGSQGKFQKFLLYAVVCPITAIQPFITLNVIFMLFTPDHWCLVPGRDNDTDIETWKTLTIPLYEQIPVIQQTFTKLIPFKSSKNKQLKCTAILQ